MSYLLTEAFRERDAKIHSLVEYGLDLIFIRGPPQRKITFSKMILAESRVRFSYLPFEEQYALANSAVEQIWRKKGWN